MKKTSLFICLAFLLATAGSTFAGHRPHAVRARSHHVHHNHHGSHWAGWHNNWHSGWHHHHHGHSIFIGSFGYPFWGYPYSAGYPYFYASFPFPSPCAYYGYNNHGAYPHGYTSHAAPGYGNSYNSGGNYNGNYHGGGDSVIARVQRQLAQEGYYQGDVDGSMGSRTYYAIRSYQRAHGIRTTGEIDNELLNAMHLR